MDPAASAGSGIQIKNYLVLRAFEDGLLYNIVLNAATVFVFYSLKYIR